MQGKEEVKETKEKKKEKVEEKIEVQEQPVNPVVTRESLNLQHFMDDMSMIGAQIKDRRLRKPAFHYGDLSVTNYLLWLILAELMMMNDRGGSE